jgi:UDP-GlcNAc:undecaprenyl-phosphate GlcNAc-1-phosphate transferase
MAGFESLTACAATGFLVSFVALFILLKSWNRRLSTRTAEFHHASASNQAPISRFGGAALAAAFATVLCLPSNFRFGFQSDHLFWVIGGASLAMFGLGFWDDLRTLGAKRKLAGQILIASAAYFSGLGIHMFKVPVFEHVTDLGFYAWPVTVFWLVAMTNLVNLIDGVDGLAGGIALMVMILLLAVGSGTGMVPQIAAGTAGALLAFLRFNFPPAKIYLGDGGAYFLGFLIGSLTICNSQKGTVVAALIAPLFVLALPILDTTLALLRRALNGLPLFRPDQRHLHHRLLQSGISRQSVTLGAYVFTAYFLGLGLLAFCWSGQYLALAFGGAMAAVLLLAFRFRFSREWFNISSVLGNALRARAEINYAMAHSRWLALEGERGGSIQGICEDTAMVARRLGFIRMRIQFEKDETVWKLSSCPNLESCAKEKEDEERPVVQVGVGACRSYVFRHQLPGQPSCFIELQTPNLNLATAARCPIDPSDRRRLIGPSKFRIVSEVLAEGWAKSITEWHHRNQLPIQLAGPTPRMASAPRFPTADAALPAT